MKTLQVLAISALTAIWLAASVRADEGRYVRENGFLYYDLYRSVPKYVNETSLQQSTRTVYKEQLDTETKEVPRTWWCPVTTYRQETEMVGRWNFFIEPYYETQIVPETRWVQHCDKVKMPVTTRKLIPETQTVQVPVTHQRVVYEKVLVSRMVVNTTASPTPAASVPSTIPNWQPAATTTLPRYQPPQPGERIGGIARLDSDPPRYSTNPSGSSSMMR
jgi:hypothetical protein